MTSSESVFRGPARNRDSNPDNESRDAPVALAREAGFTGKKSRTTRCAEVVYPSSLRVGPGNTTASHFRR